MGLSETTILILPPRAGGTSTVLPGFKRTEVGVIPRDWSISSLRDLGQCLSGGTPRKNEARFWGGEIPWVSSKDMKMSRLYDAIDHVTTLAIGNGTRLVETGTILMVVRGMSLVHSFPVSIIERSMAFNQDIKAFVPHTHVSGEFVLRWLQANQRSMLSLATEATHGTKRMPTADLLDSQVPVPDLSEQRVIAKAISDVEGLVDALHKVIAKKRAIKQATMQQLLTGKTRLPGFEKQRGLQRTDADEIPRDWESLPIGDLFAFKNGLNKAKKYFGFGTPIVNYMDVFGNPGLHASDLLGRVCVSTQEIKNFEVRKGDVFFTRTSETVEEVGIASVMLGNVTDTVFSGFVLRARPKDDRLDDLFKKYCFAATPVRRQIVSTSTYTTRALTNGRVLSAVSIARPPLPEQRAIATVLSAMDAEIAALERRRDKTRQIKQGMMQQLLTGRVRLV